MTLGLINRSKPHKCLSYLARLTHWPVYLTVEYKQGQSPRLLVTGNVPQTRNVSDNNPCVVRLSPDNRIVLVAAEQSVLCYSTATAALVHSLLNIYAGVSLRHRYAALTVEGQFEGIFVLYMKTSTLHFSMLLIQVFMILYYCIFVLE